MTFLIVTVGRAIYGTGGSFCPRLRYLLQTPTTSPQSSSIIAAVTKPGRKWT